MRPVHLYATITTHQQQQLLDAVHGRWRVAVRIIMILLSAHGFSPTQIADLLHYDPHTVRRWIARWHTEGASGLADRPRPGRPRLGSPRLGQRIQTLLAQPKPGPPPGSGGNWDDQRSACAPCTAASASRHPGDDRD
jgi:hypothetical protein